MPHAPTTVFRLAISVASGVVAALAASRAALAAAKFTGADAPRAESAVDSAAGLMGTALAPPLVICQRWVDAVYVTVAVSAGTRNWESSVSMAEFVYSGSGSVLYVKFASCALIVGQIGASSGIEMPSWFGLGFVSHHCDMYSV